MNSIEELTEYFKKFPGIGPRQANRFVHYLLRQNQSDLELIAGAINNLKEDVGQCSSCYRFYPSKNSSNLCSICQNKNRNHQVLMIVANDTDIDSIEKSNNFNGLYFVFGGLIPILNKDPNKMGRINKLIAKIQKDNFEEIIIALNANPEGENTTEIIKKEIQNLNSKNSTNSPKISVLGRGLSTGTEIEYSDAETLKNALLNRG